MIDIRNLEVELAKDILLPSEAEKLEEEKRQIEIKINTLNEESRAIWKKIYRSRINQAKLDFFKFWGISGTPEDDAVILQSNSGESIIVHIPSSADSWDMFHSESAVKVVLLSLEFPQDEGMVGSITNTTYPIDSFRALHPLDYECDDYLDVMTAYKVFEKMGAVSL